jgi:hypothetical protein
MLNVVQVLIMEIPSPHNGGEGDPVEMFRFKGVPIELDATDKLENPDQNSDAVNMGHDYKTV